MIGLKNGNFEMNLQIRINFAELKQTMNPVINSSLRI